MNHGGGRLIKTWRAGVDDPREGLPARMGRSKKPSEHACKVAAMISLVHTTSGLLLVGGF